MRKCVQFLIATVSDLQVLFVVIIKIRLKNKSRAVASSGKSETVQQYYKINLFRAQLADSHRCLRTKEETQQGHDRIWTQLTSEGGVTYLWLKPTGQYEMKQTSDEVRCIIMTGNEC